MAKDFSLQPGGDYLLMATCPKGLEAALAKELEELGALEIKEAVAAVFFRASLAKVYHVISWSRIANRVILVLLRERLDDVDQFRQAISCLGWPDYFSINKKIAVAFRGNNKSIRNENFGAQITKDAIQNSFNQKAEARTDSRLYSVPRLTVDLEQPEVLIYVRAFKNRYVAGIDLVGDSLHKRGYRVVSGAAPVKENLAAAILRLSRWHEMINEALLANTEGEKTTFPSRYYFIDPFCGSATIIIEAVLMAMNVAPSYLKPDESWLHRHLSFFDEDEWRTARKAINESRIHLEATQESSGLSSASDHIQTKPTIAFGSDVDPRSMHAARENIAAALLKPYVTLKQCDIDDLRLPDDFMDDKEHDLKRASGLLLTNPPYGSRLGDVETIKPLYRSLGQLLLTQCGGWEAAILTGNPDLGWETRLRSWRQHKVFNGAIACKLQRFRIDDRVALAATPEKSKSGSVWKSVEGDLPLAESMDDASAVQIENLSEEALMVFNRLKKNRRRLSGLLRNIGLSPYRLYDRDLPEYAFLLDCYPEYREDAQPNLNTTKVLVQEYAPPDSVDKTRVLQRRREFASACSAYFEIPLEQILVTQRERQRGRRQYEARSSKSGSVPSSDVAQTIICQEKVFRCYVDLESYLDSGLFVDSRGVREWITAQATGKNFLNLFAYTATATLAAVAGGAKSSLSLDMSNTYLAWARRNFALNDIDVRRHQLRRADCLEWLKQDGQRFDLILLDPPSFSNSSRMNESLDIQRDHTRLVIACMERLNKDGVMLFCNNRRGFKLNSELENRFSLTELTRLTLHKDCEGSRQAHRSWAIRH